MNSARDNSFVPLTTAAPSTSSRKEFNVSVLSSAEAAQPFRSLAQSLKTPPTSPHTSNCQPRVTVQREGDRVSAIQVHCACGQVIEIACVYDVAPEHAAKSASAPETFSSAPAKSISKLA
jgi:hypothetical protein